MKILIVTGIYPPDIGGPATYSKLLMEELPWRNIEVSLLNFGEFKKYPKILRHFLFFLEVLARGKNVDIIYAQDPVSVGLPTALANIFLHKVFILKIVGDYAWEQSCQRFEVRDLLDDFSVNYDKYSWAVKFFKNIQLFSAKHAKAIIVPSNYLKKIVSNWGIKEDKIKVIYNAFDGIAFTKIKEEVRKNLNLNGKILISVGRLVPWKGMEMLVKLMPDIIAKIPDVKLVVAGDGTDKEKLKKTVADLNLQDKVFLVGKLDHQELMNYLIASDLFLLNTSYEGFSHQLLEVMNIGLPIITTQVGGNPELVEHNQNGLMLPYNNFEVWLKEICGLLSDEKKRMELGLKAKKKAGLFGKDKMITELTEFLQKNL